jgi:predicted TIM-barrel fold metal-dependent hydrolase
LCADSRSTSSASSPSRTASTIVDFILGGAATAYPRIRLIVPHLGGVLPLLTERVEAFRTIDGEPADRITVAASLRRFYYDLAGMPSDQQISRLGSIAAPEHLLYGSDYAWTRRGLVLEMPSALDATMPVIDRDWRALTTRNADRLLRTPSGYLAERG